VEKVLCFQCSERLDGMEICETLNVSLSGITLLV